MGKEYFGQYKVESELGRGGMGVVFKAYDDALNRHVAIKVLSEQLATDESVVERFKREAKSMAALNDASIIQIYFIGEDDGQPYFVMEYVEGESLSERLKRDGQLSIDESINILKQAARGLAVAHDKGVVHRDIKPGNLMLGSNGSVKLADFGIAMVQDLSKRLTNTGEFVGTPGYLSPEVCIGQPVDQRSDIFALGIVLYEMLTGDIPFTEASPLGMMLEVVKAEIPDVRSVNADVDERTCQILARMIAKDPDQRYPDCHELLADINGSGPVAGPAPVAGPSAAGSAFQSARTTALSQLEALPDLEGGLGTGSVAATRVSGPGSQLPPDNSQAGAAGGGGSADAGKTRSGPRWLPAAVAALLLIGIGGGVLFVFQDQLLGEEPQESVVLGKARTVEDAADDTPLDGADLEKDLLAASDDQLIAPPDDGALDDAIQRAGAAGTPTPDNTGSKVADPVPPRTALTPKTAGSNDAATAAEEITAAVTPLQVASATTNPISADRTPQRVSGIASQKVDQNVDQTADQIAAQNGIQSGAGAVVSQANPTESATAGASGKSSEPPLQLASVSEPPPVARDPRMVVMAVGDRALAGPVEQLLENALLDHELDVMDEAFFEDVGRYANENGVDLPGLSRVIQDNGADVLVLAEIDYIGETQLEYYGQFSTLYSVNLKIRNISLADRRPLGRGWTKKVDFTTLNADEKAQEAVGPIVDDVARSLVDLKNR